MGKLNDYTNAKSAYFFLNNDDLLDLKIMLKFGNLISRRRVSVDCESYKRLSKQKHLRLLITFIGIMVFQDQDVVKINYHCKINYL